MNLDQIIADVRTVCRDSAGAFVTDADVVSWANQAQLDVASRLLLLEKEWTGTTDGTNAIAIPYDLVEARTLRIGTDDYEFTDDDVFWSWSDAGSGAASPLLAREFANKFELYPTPDSGLAWKIRGKRKPVTLILGETGAAITILGATAAAEIGTFDTAAAHSLAVGDIVDVIGLLPTAYNGTWAVASLPFTTQFTAHIGSTPAASTQGGTLQRTDVPEIPEEQHIRIVSYCRFQARLKQGEHGDADRYFAMYDRGLPEPPSSRARIMPGPLHVSVEPGPFDSDPDAMHI